MGLALLLAAGVSDAQTQVLGPTPRPANTVTVMSLHGHVECRRAGSAAWVRVARAPLTLRPGDALHTTASGTCSVRDHGTLEEVDPNSYVYIPQEPRGGGLWEGVRLLLGKVRFWILGDQKSGATSLAAKAVGHGTVFEMEVAQDGTTTITVAEGVVTVSNAFGTVEVGANQRTVVQVGSAPVAPFAVDASQLLVREAELPSLPVETEVRLAPEAGGDVAAQARDAAEAARAAPEDAEAQLKAAALLHDASEPVEAEPFARRAVELAPGDGHAGAVLAVVLLAERRPEGALAAAEATPAGPWRQFAQGVVRLAGGNAEAALPLLEEATAEVPEANLQASMAAARLGRAALARQYASAAPTDDRSLALRADLSLAAGDLDGAGREADAALAANPRSAAALVARAAVDMFGGHLDAARENADRALALRPQSAPAHALDADILALQSHLAAAENQAGQAVALDPQYGPAWRTLGTVYAAEGAYPQAARALGRAVKLQPAMVSAYSTLAVVYSRQGKIGQALSQFQTAFALGSTTMQMENDYGALLVSMGRTEEGLDHLRQAADRAREAGRVWALPLGNMAIGYLDLNRYAEAERYALEAVGAAPASAPIRTIAARVFMSQERYLRAAAELRKALDLDPDYALARVKLAEIYHLRGQDREASKETLLAGFTDARSVVEQRLYSRTEVRGQAGSWLGRLKTDGIGSNGQSAYFGSIVRYDSPTWRTNNDWEEQDIQLLAGYRTLHGDRHFLRVTDGQVVNGRPGSIFEPDPDYRTRAHETTVEAGRRHWLSEGTSVTVLGHYRRTTLWADNPDSMATNTSGQVIDSRPYLYREVGDSYNGAEINLRHDLRADTRLNVGAAAEWGEEGASGSVWEVTGAPGSVVAGHVPFELSQHDSRGTGYVEWTRTCPDTTLRLGGFVTAASGETPIWRPRAAWIRSLTPTSTLWLSTYPILRDDVSSLSPTDPWRQDHGIESINFAPGGFGQFYEARYQSQGRRDLVELLGFYRTYEGLLVFVQSPQWQPEGGYYVVPKGHAYGAQVGLERALNPRLTLAAEATWTRSHDNSTGRDIPYTPDWKGQVSGYYMDATGWRIDAVLRLVGRRDHRFADGSYQRLGSYATLDARVSRQLSTEWELYAQGANLLDRDYDYWYGFPELGRHIAVGFNRLFW